MPAVFPYPRASLILAESNYFGRKATCQKYQVPSSTYDDWKARLKKDDQLIQMYNEELTKLREDWQEDTIRTLKKALSTVEQALINHPFKHEPKTVEERLVWAKNVEALAKVIGAVGDMAVGGHVLLRE